MPSGLQAARVRGKRFCRLRLLRILDAGEAGKLMRRGAGRRGAGADLILELAEMARCALAAFEGGEQALLEDLAHPGDRLLGAARTKRAGLVKRGVTLADLGPQLVQPAVVARRKRQHLRIPTRMASGENMQASAVFDCRSFGALDIVAVGLVDGDDVGELEQAALDALQLVAGARDATTTKTSTILATAVSDWPTPTVSTSTTS